MSTFHIFPPFLAQPISKKMSRYCYSAAVGVYQSFCMTTMTQPPRLCHRRHAKTLIFSNISVNTEDIYLKLKTSCLLSKGEPIPVGQAAAIERWHLHMVLLLQRHSCCDCLLPLKKEALPK